MKWKSRNLRTVETEGREMLDVTCPYCGGEFMQVETENTLDLICLGCRVDSPEARRHARIEPPPLKETERSE